MRVAWRVEIEAGASKPLRSRASEGLEAGEAAEADAGGAAPGQRAGEGAQSRAALSFKASRDALVMLRDRLCEAEAAAAAMC